MTRAPVGWFVTGTDTGVGKTCVAAGLLTALGQYGYSTVGMKPVASGGHHTAAGVRNQDAEILIAASTVQADYESVNPYVFEPAVAPHIAAQQVGAEIQLTRIHDAYRRLTARADVVVVEGAGGWRVPLNREHDMANLGALLGLPVILVVGLRLGCINHALLTAEAVKADGLAVAGWVANEIEPDMPARNDNIAAIRDRIGAPLLASIPRLAAPTSAQVARYWDMTALLARR